MSEQVITAAEAEDMVLLVRYGHDVLLDSVRGPRLRELASRLEALS